jgi:tRNA (guanine37-N1)-methyltransferase
MTPSNKILPIKKIPKRKHKLVVDIITLFPNIFDSIFAESLFHKAVQNSIVSVTVHNVRDYADRVSDDAHWRYAQVDDKPFGGGPGMVLMVSPIVRAVSRIRAQRGIRGSKIILFSPRGTLLTGTRARALSRSRHLILICGRYEGVDERVAEHLADEVISIGDYVLSGGELPAAVTLEAICRFLPGFIGNQESLEEIHGSIPVYTRPAVFRTSPRSRPWIVPNVLLSGNHADIATWRKRHQKPTR